ncbi:MAG TPA: TonB-dependent receptor, partial [Candidatus Kapabacteria bacterium]
GGDGIVDIYTPVNRQIPDPNNPTQPYASQIPGPNPFTGHIEGPPIIQSSGNGYGIVGLSTVAGNTSGFSIENTGQTQINGNYTIQVGSHQLEAGFESNIMSVYQYNNSLPWDANPFKDSFLVHPYTGAIFLMDKMEFSDITFHPGIRFDIYQPDANQIPDLYNPIGVGIANYALTPTKLQTQISPRLAITYAVTDQTTFNFGYNWYFEKPNLNDVLTSTGGGNVNALEQSLARGNQTLGQAGLNAERTKEIDVGFNTQLSDVFAFSVTGVYKDIRNQTGEEFITSPILPIGYTVFTDDEYGTDRSIEFVAEKRMSDNYSIKLNYTYGAAVGTSSSATENYAALINQDPNSEQSVLPLTPFPFSYDRTHVANLLFNLVYNKGEGPTIFGNKLLQWLSLQTTTVFETGTPYTATDIRGAQIGSTNGNRLPDNFETDATLTRTIPFEDLFGASMSSIFLDLQLEVINVFNRTDPLWVYPATGQANNDGLPNQLGSTIDYYNDPTNTRGGQIDALGNLYYDSRLDLNHDGRVSAAEQQISYVRYRTDNYNREVFYQVPRRVYLNFTLRF